MKRIKYERGDWQVRRNCCISGYCSDCHARGTLGRPAQVVIQGNGYSKAYATQVAERWHNYKAVAERMQ